MFEKDHLILGIRKFGTTLQHSIFAQIETVIRQWGLESLWVKRIKPMTWTCRITRSQILCIGLDDVEKLKSIVGVTSVWIEEATEITPNDFNQLNLRLRGHTLCYKQIILSFNPISIHHWLKAKFFDTKSPSVNATTTTFYDNLFLDAEYYRDVLMPLEHTDPYMWKVYGLGEWGILGNVIFGYFDEEYWPTQDDVKLGEGEFLGDELFYGLDFGYNHPCALEEVRLWDGHVFITEKIYARHLTITQLIETMDGMDISFKAPIYCDNARPDDIREIQLHGYNAWPCDKGPGSVLKGIDLLKELKRTNMIHSRKENVNLNAELTAYKWKENKDGEVIDPEEPVPFKDHGIDAVRYAIYTHRRQRFEGEYFTVIDLIQQLESPIVTLL